jgi:hypothetical protein
MNILLKAVHSLKKIVSTDTDVVQLDVVSSLKLWILLNRENVSQSDESAAWTSLSGDSPAILLSQEAIEHILKGLSKVSAMDVGDWIADGVRSGSSRIIQQSPRCASTR